MQTYSSKHYDYLRQSGKILRETFAVVEKSIRAGVTTLELDKIAEDYIRSQGAEPAFKNYQGYKFTICASVNEESIHGMPRKNKVLCDGDIISVDCGVRFPKKDNESMCTDAARTYAVGKITPKAQKLVDACKQCFDVAIDGLRAGDMVKEIGKKIERFVAGRYGIIDTYFGHGIGHNVHEGTLVPNFDVDKMAKHSPRLVSAVEVEIPDGAIMCIEPMINCGTKDIKLARDGWTVVTADGQLAAHYENTIIVHHDRVEIVT